MYVVRSFGVRLDLFGCWTEFDDPIDCELGIDHRVDVGRNRPVFLDDSIDEPTGHAFALTR